MLPKIIVQQNIVQNVILEMNPLPTMLFRHEFSPVLEKAIAVSNKHLLNIQCVSNPSLEGVLNPFF